MKKLLFVLAIASFAACSNGPAKTGGADSTKVDSTKSVVDSTKKDTTKMAMDTTKKDTAAKK